MNNFNVRQAENGWIVTRNEGMGSRGHEWVFATLDDMTAWLKSQCGEQPA